MSENFDTAEDENSATASSEDEDDVATTSQTTSDSEVPQTTAKRRTYPVTSDATSPVAGNGNGNGNSKNNDNDDDEYHNEDYEPPRKIKLQPSHHNDKSDAEEYHNVPPQKRRIVTTTSSSSSSSSSSLPNNDNNDVDDEDYEPQRKRRLEASHHNDKNDAEEYHNVPPQKRRIVTTTTTSSSSSLSLPHNDNNVDDDDNNEEAAVQTPNPDGNMSVVAIHYNELKESGRKERIKSKIFFMRNFNNWIKCMLINEYMDSIKQQQRNGDPIRVLDMCCGKGGDLLKWEKAKIKHLICTDIAEVSVDQCQRRYNDMVERADKSKFAHKFTAEFFACDSTLTRLRERYKDASLKLHLVSCQFAFHYSFESLSQADCMVRNAAECLTPGGYFIATIPDASEIMRRLAASDNGKKFGNDIYSIEFISQTDPPPLFGAKYQFHLEGVVDCPEFLVHFPTFVKLCRKNGLKLVRKTTFADYYKEMIPTGKQLLQRMKGLETVYGSRHANDEQYSHIRKIHGSNRGRPVGTLTKSEWEATTLYLVCAFEKCKNTWDAEGKPVFEFD